MTVVVARCPKCQSTSCHPVFVANDVQCIDCGEIFSMCPPLTKQDVLDAHAQFGKLNWQMVKDAMGPNWPPEWETIGPGEAIFHADEGSHS